VLSSVTASLGLIANRNRGLAIIDSCVPAYPRRSIEIEEAGFLLTTGRTQRLRFERRS
jgi:hypothetical protein